MSADFTESKKTSRLVYAGRMLEVREDDVLLPDGKEARREYVVHPGAALILPLLMAGKYSCSACLLPWFCSSACTQNR